MFDGLLMARNSPRTDNIPLWLGGLKGDGFEREFFKEYEHPCGPASRPFMMAFRMFSKEDL